MRAFARLCFLATAATLLGGCYFDHPLTGGPSKDINTWILGVWQSTDAKGRTSKVLVSPISGGKYFVKIEATGKNRPSTGRMEFEGWPARVGDTTFLSLRCLNGTKEIPAGAHVFVQVQLLNQNTVRVRALQLDAPQNASSFELRKAVREKLKSKSLYAPETTTWTRVAEVFWSGNGEDPVFTPIRNPMYLPLPGQPPAPPAATPTPTPTVATPDGGSSSESGPARP